MCERESHWDLHPWLCEAETSQLSWGVAVFCEVAGGPTFAYPAYILALRSGGEGLRADDGAPSKKGPRWWGTHPPVLGSYHCGGWGWGLCVGFFVHLRKKSEPETTSLHTDPDTSPRHMGLSPQLLPIPDHLVFGPFNRGTWRLPGI